MTLAGHSIAERQDNGSGLAALVHLSALIGVFGFFLQIIMPLILWLIFRSGRPAVNRSGKEALNFQISMLLYQILFIILLVVVAIAVLGTGDFDAFSADMTDEELGDALIDLMERLIIPGVIAVFLIFAMFVFWVFMIFRAAVRAGQGDRADYLFAIQFIRVRD